MAIERAESTIIKPSLFPVDLKGEWLAYGVAGVMKAVNLVLWRIGSQNMPLGDYAAIDVSGVMFAPVLASILRRKCVKVNVGHAKLAPPKLLMGITSTPKTRWRNSSASDRK